MRPGLPKNAALCWLLPLVPLGCGATDKATPNPTPDVAGGGQIGAGSGGQQTAVGGSGGDPNVAGAGGAGGAIVAGNAGSAGANVASAGTAGLSAACGGALAGAWTARQEPTVVKPPSGVDACFYLLLGAGGVVQQLRHGGGLVFERGLQRPRERWLLLRLRNSPSRRLRRKVVARAERRDSRVAQAPESEERQGCRNLRGSLLRQRRGARPWPRNRPASRKYVTAELRPRRLPRWRRRPRRTRSRLRRRL
jgi:hypothetical protein